MIQLSVETCTTCNALCHFCEYKDSKGWRAGKVMPLELYCHLVDQVSDIPEITLINLSGLNEPLLDRHLEERIAYTRRVAPGVRIQVFTNGIRLTPTRFHALRDAGLDNLVISLNATNAEQHRRIMGVPGQYERICANVLYALAMGGAVRVHALITGDTFTEQDAERFKKLWGRVAYCRYDYRLGHMDNPDSCCWRALGMINVTCDGLVTPCVFDHSGKMVMGDLNTQTLREIYNNDPYLAFRTAHESGNATRYSMCRDCKRGYDER